MQISMIAIGQTLIGFTLSPSPRTWSGACLPSLTRKKRRIPAQGRDDE